MAEKTITTALKRFSEGKESAFLFLFDVASAEVWSLITPRFGENRNLSEYLHTLAMDRLLGIWWSDAALYEWSEEVFMQRVRDAVEGVIGDYEALLDRHYPSLDVVLIDQDYASQLKLKLKAKFQLKKAQNPNFLAYYWEHFRFYFTGACVVVGIGFFLLLFGFVSINKAPSIFANAKILTMTGNMAFGRLDFDQSEGNEQSMTGISMWSQESVRYRIGKGQLPSWNKEYYVLKEQSKTEISPTPLLKNLNLPAIRWSNLQKSQLSSLVLMSGDVEISLDLGARKMTFVDPTLPAKKSEFLTSESAIKKKVRNQISAFGLSLEQYGVARIQEEFGDGFVKLFIPRKLYEKAVYSASGLEQGMHVYYYKPGEQVLSVENYDFEQYLVSKYETIDQDSFLQKAQEIGFDTKGTFADADRVAMGEVVYKQVGAYLVPALKLELAEKVVLLDLI